MSLPADSLPPDHEVIGVLGGMGPAATADFYAKLVALTPADRDQDHPRVVIWADPTVPDRTRALLGDGPDPSGWLRHGAQVLADPVQPRTRQFLSRIIEAGRL